MRVGDLPLHTRYVGHFEERGIRELYPPQAAAVEAGVCEGASIVAAVPTASGKTLIAQLAALTCGGPAVYVVPLRALATEKAETFDALPGTSVGVATGDYDATDDDLADADVVVATAEKVDAAIRHGTAWVERVSCAVLDEVHLLDDASRGPTLEVTIAKLRRLNPDVQLVALSATVPNADAVAEWLDATVVHSDWRPVDLRTGVYADGTVTFVDDATVDDTSVDGDGSVDAGTEGGDAGADGDVLEIEPGDRSPTVALVADALADGGQCLAFVNSRRAARALARELVASLDPPLLPDGSVAANGGEVADGASGGSGATGPVDGPAAVAADVRETARTVTGESLAELAEAGVAFHHAGLRGEHRTRVEAGFRAGELGVICATPTLAAGVNVPARRVIVRDHRRFGDAGYEPLSTLEVRQMFGRAGRPGLDPYGEAVLVADDADERETLVARYVEADPDPVESRLDDPAALRPHVLASVASGVVATRAELRALLRETFCAHSGGGDALVATAEDAVDRLAGAGMLTVDGRSESPGPGGERDPDDALDATELGALVSRVYVDPGTGADVIGALERAETLERVTTLTVCEIVCDTTEMPTRYVRQDEAGELSEFALRNADELAKPVRDFDGDFHGWLATLKTARLLADYAEGAPLDELVERYAVGPGDVRRFAERAEWLCSATESLAEHVDSALTDRIRDTRERLSVRLE